MARNRVTFESITAEFFAKRVTFGDSFELDCWLWNLSCDSKGYGQLRFMGKTVRAHRFYFNYFKWPLKKNQQTHHICENKKCVNPEHMKVVSLVENILMPDGAAGINKAKTKCCKDHKYDQENTGYNKNGSRYCKKCRSIYRRSYYLKNKK